MAKISRFYEVETEEKARALLRAEADNWTWLSKEEKDHVVEATAERTETKFGPVYHISFSRV